MEKRTVSQGSETGQQGETREIPLVYSLFPILAFMGIREALDRTAREALNIYTAIPLPISWFLSLRVWDVRQTMRTVRL